MNNIQIDNYSERALVIRGEGTKDFISELKNIGAKWNRNLSGGPGWIISKKKENIVRGLFDDSNSKSISPVKEIVETESNSSKEQIPKKCQQYSKKVNKNTLENINNFCNLLTANKVKDSKKEFIKLPYIVQCMFLHYSWEILSHRKKYSDQSYINAFYLFKLFRGKEMKGKKIYNRYLKLKTLDTYYTKARDFNKKSNIVTGSSTISKSSRKKYDKQYQRYKSPEGELDPLFLYYTSLYSQKPNSPLAITWLTEHGVFDKKDRKSLIKKYEKLKSAGKLIR